MLYSLSEFFILFIYAFFLKFKELSDNFFLTITDFFDFGLGLNRY